MIKTTFKAHPIMVLTLMKPYLFVLVLPLIRAIFQYITTKTFDGLLSLETVAFLFVLGMAYLSYRAMSVTVSGTRLIVKKGVIIRRHAAIELSRLSSMALRRNPLDYLVGSVECSVNTEAGNPKSSDFAFRMYQTDINRLLNMVYGDSNRETVKFSSTKIALLAATTSSALSGMIIGVPVVNQLGDLLGIAVTDVFLNEISNISSRMERLVPPIVNTVTLIVLAAYGVSFLTSFFKNVNFKLKSDKNVVEVKSGLIIRRHIIFKKTQVNNVCIEQTPLMHLFKKFSMRVSIGGYGNSRGEKAVVVPIASYKGLKGELERYFPTFDTKADYIESPRTAKARNRFFFVPFVWLALIASGAAALAIFFKGFDSSALFLLGVLLGLDLYYAFFCYRNYKYSRISFKNSVFASGMVGFNVRELYCDKNNIGLIKITQTPADRRYGTCKVKLTVRSEKADSVRVKILNTQTVLNAVKEAYDLKNIIL